MFWPCDLVIFIGYLFAPFSCGLSLFLPNLCIGDAKKSFIKMVERMNKLKLEDKGLRIAYRQRCFTSWLELKIERPK